MKDWRADLEKQKDKIIKRLNRRIWIFKKLHICKRKIDAAEFEIMMIEKSSHWNPPHSMVFLLPNDWGKR